MRSRLLFSLTLSCVCFACANRSPNPAPKEATANEPSADESSAPQGATPSAPLRAGCGDRVCEGKTPICCFDGAAGKGRCLSIEERDGGACQLGEQVYELSCASARDCSSGICCLFNHITSCSDECAHLGQTCEVASDCPTALGPASCGVDSEAPPFVKHCWSE